MKQDVPAILEMLEPRTLLSLAGNMLFPADNPWNHPITDAPVAANSATLVASIGGTKPLHPDFGSGLYAGGDIGIPYNVVTGSQPTVNVVIDAYPDESDLEPVPIPANAVIEGDPLPAEQNTGDRHLLVYDETNNIVYELFNAHRPSEESDNQWHADSEAVWNLNVDTFRTPGYTSADAAGLPILPGLTRADEAVDQGAITHALRFTVPKSDNAYVFPASHEAGVNNPALPRMGERFRLKASFDISSFSATDQVILQALKTYGMIAADNGSAWFLSGAPSDEWDNDDLHNLTSILGNNFEAVDLTPVVSSLDQTSGPASGGTVVTVHGVNFTGTASQTNVYFNGIAATSVTIVSDTVLQATAPAQSAGAYDVTVDSPYGNSTTSAADTFTYYATGLAATYYPTINFTGSPRSETDAAVNFTWGTAGPAILNLPPWSAATGSSPFSATWTGSILADAAGSYTFHTLADDGVRVLIDGVTVINAMTDTPRLPGDMELNGTVNLDDLNTFAANFGKPTSGGWSAGDFTGTGTVNLDDLSLFATDFGKTTPPQSNSAAVTLTAGWHNIEVDYYQKEAIASVDLKWSTPDGAYTDATVPNSHLSPADAASHNMVAAVTVKTAMNATAGTTANVATVRGTRMVTANVATVPGTRALTAYPAALPLPRAVSTPPTPARVVAGSITPPSAFSITSISSVAFPPLPKGYFDGDGGDLFVWGGAAAHIKKWF